MAPTTPGPVASPARRASARVRARRGYEVPRRVLRMRICVRGWSRGTQVGRRMNHDYFLRAASSPLLDEAALRRVLAWLRDANTTHRCAGREGGGGAG